MKITILGGYHNGNKFNVDDQCRHISLAEEPKMASYAEFSKDPVVTVKTHSYKKVDAIFRKTHPLGYLEMEDIGLFVPVETTSEYISTLLSVLGITIKAEYKLVKVPHKLY